MTIAVGHGKHAARNIDAFLRGESFMKAPKKDLASFDKLHLWYYTSVEQRPQAHAEMQRRRTSFEEVVQGLNEKEAVYGLEALPVLWQLLRVRRLLRRLSGRRDRQARAGKRYQYIYELCTGCAVCFEQCPCHSISMIPEPIAVA